jgi:16S rRNA (cytosine1402-N4)-methyltransferase
LEQDDLAAMLWRYGDERNSKRIAAQIVAARPIRTVGQLTRAIEQVAGRARSSIHPATKTFQALRIAVNEELEALADALRQAPDLLASGGRLVVISFHSLEDRMVKQFMQAESKGCICPPAIPVCVCGHVARFRRVTKGAEKPSEREVETNRRARSAKLRAAERLAS